MIPPRAIPALGGILIAGWWGAGPAGADSLPVPGAIRGHVTADGASVSGRFTVANRGSERSRPASVELYLSADGLVDPADLRLDERSLAPLAPGAEQEVAIIAPHPELPPGRYYLIVRVRAPGGDHAPPAHQLWGAPMRLGPDLALDELASDDDGRTLRVSGRVTNLGSRAAGPSRVAFELIDDHGGAALPLTRVELPPLRPGASTAVNGTASLPGATGRYRLVAEVDADQRVAEADETNNRARVDGHYALGPDLTVAALAAAVEDGLIAVVDTVANRGTAAADACGISFFLSRNGVLDADDVPLGYRVVAPLPAGETATGTTRLAAPRRVATGRYYLLGKIDSSGAVAESDERNNVGLAPDHLDLRRSR